MPKVGMTICYPVYVEVDVDLDQLHHDDYVEEIKEKAKDEADNVIVNAGIKPYVQTCNYPQLVD